MDLIGLPDFREWIARFFESSKRIYIVSKKPDSKEYSTMAKVTGIGIILVGIIGYIVTLIFALAGLLGT